MTRIKIQYEADQKILCRGSSIINRGFVHILLFLLVVYGGMDTSGRLKNRLIHNLIVSLTPTAYINTFTLFQGLRLNRVFSSTAFFPLQIY